MIFTLVAACSVLTEQRCDASCGDYLVHPGASGSHSLNQTDSPTNRPTPVCPCQRPGCSSRSEVPTVPVPVPPEIPVEWACFVAQIRDRDDASHAWSLESELLLLLLRMSGQRLDRPPQGRA